MGDMLRGQTAPSRPAHIHMIVRADGHRTLTTHIFDAESDYLDSDASVRHRTVEMFNGSAADQPTPDRRSRLSVHFNIVLAPAE